MLGLAGAALIGLAFRIQAQANADNAVRDLLGTRAQGTMGPWVVGAVGAILLVFALVLVVLDGQQSRPREVPMGWHEDPHDPTLLRYHDGSDWTDRTAAKS